MSAPASMSASLQHGSRWQNANALTSPGLSASPDLDPQDLVGIEEEDLDPVAEHYVSQYSASELRTFHCERVRKMPLSSLDPSMLLGFLCKDEHDWVELRRRLDEVW